MRRFVAIAIIMIFIVILNIFVPFRVNAIDNTDYVLDTARRGHRIPIPLTYSVKKVIANLEIGNLNNAQDLFIDQNNILYVADTGNNRVVKLTRDGKVLDVFTGPPERPFNSPKGVYVDSDGDIYVADTGNRRIVHLAPDGRFVEEFVKPESAMLSNLSFDPAKIYINRMGYIYILNESNYYGFLTIDAHNNFRGYIGATRVTATFRDWIIRNFATEEQKARIANLTAPPYSNFVIGKDGMIYATAVSIDRDQIRKINSVGKNIYPSGEFGEMIIGESGPVLPYFVDIAVDKNGIISVLEREGCKVYQYDQLGNLLTVFGSKGKWKGAFQIPSSLAVDTDGNIYVLDSDLNNIQVFGPTHFINLIHQAVTLYSEGRYEQAADLWKQVLEIDANYELAHRGIAMSLYKNGRWKEAMEEYKKGNDPAGYSTAFAEYRRQLFRAYFGWVVLSLIILTTGLILGVKYLKNLAKNYFAQYVYGEFN